MTVSRKCTRCGGRYSWKGEVTRPPACPHCGHRPPDPSATDERIARQFDGKATPLLPGLEAPR